MTRAYLAVALSALTVAAACQTERLRLKHATLPRITLPERAPLTLRAATFNAGLAPGAVPHTAARVPAVISALASEPLDLLCVQEFWLEEHWNALRSATAKRLPHALRPPARSDGGTKPCGAAELAPVARCALTSCWSEGSSGAADCAMKSCGHLAKTLSPECIGCLTRDPLRRVGEILDDCVDPNLAAGTQPTEHKELSFFDGSYGIGLLSAQPLQDVDRLDLKAGHHPRAVLHARVRAGEQRLHVFCTHLTPILRGVPHPSGGSWETEQAEQVEAMLDWIDEKAGTEPALVLGDLNTGPAAGSIRARAPAHYARFITEGFVNPYLDASSSPRCTYCYDNPVLGKRGGGLSIDHALLKNFRGTADATRFLDGRVELRIDEKTQPMALSDHYGVVIELSPEP